MNVNKQIEKNLSDAITEKPVRFRVGKRNFSLYPPTLGKMQLLKSLFIAIDVNTTLLTTNPLVETLRLCREHPDTVCQIIACSTFNDRRSINDTDKIAQRSAFFRQDMEAEDLATILSLILAADNTEEFVKYLGIDVERDRRMQISRIKGEGNSLTFGGKSIYGLLIDFACQRYGWTLDYVLWGISLVNLNMLMADAITTVYLSDEERKKLGMGAGEVIDADDPANNALLRRIISE